MPHSAPTPAAVTRRPAATAPAGTPPRSTEPEAKPETQLTVQQPVPAVNLKEPERLTIPAKTKVHIQLVRAIEASSTSANEVFPVALAAPLSIEDRIVAPNGSAADVILTKLGGSKKSPKVQFQLSSINVSGKTYKVKSDTFEFNDSLEGKRAGKMSGIGNAVGSLVGGKPSGVSIELPADTEMVFTLKAPIFVTLDSTIRP
jgi:hypothetical protein